MIWPSRWPPALVFWLMVALVYGVVALALALLGVPSPFLFAGVLAGGGCALRLANPRPFPDKLRQIGLAVIGAGAGSRIDEDVVSTLLSSPAAVLGGVVATLAVTMACGQVLRLSPYVNGPTAVFASIAGGASGVSAVAREMDADDTIVLSVQYLRVLFVLASVPVVAPLLGAAELGGDASADSAVGWSDVAFTTVSVLAGLALARVLRFSASRLVLPLLVASTLSVTSAFPSSTVPLQVLDVGYAITGLMVGLSFTPAAVRQLTRLMPLAVLQLVLSVAGCAVVGLVFADVAGVSRLDGYLATTPGGLPAVTAVAISSGAAVGIIITMQILRVFTALLLAPLLGAYFQRRRPTRGDAGGQGPGC